jgi:hypothetical protein
MAIPCSLGGLLGFRSPGSEDVFDRFAGAGFEPSVPGCPRQSATLFRYGSTVEARQRAFLGNGVRHPIGLELAIAYR